MTGFSLSVTVMVNAGQDAVSPMTSVALHVTEVEPTANCVLLGVHEMVSALYTLLGLVAVGRVYT